MSLGPDKLKRCIIKIFKTREMLFIKRMKRKFYNFTMSYMSFLTDKHINISNLVSLTSITFFRQQNDMDKDYINFIDQL